MNEEHLTSEQIKRFQLRALAPNEVLPTQRHIAQCEQCRQAVFGGVSPTHTLNTSNEPHLTLKQITDYCIGNLTIDERLPLTLHVSHCSFCRSDLAEVHRLHRECDGIHTHKKLNDISVKQKEELSKVFLKSPPLATEVLRERVSQALGLGSGGSPTLLAHLLSGLEYLVPLGIHGLQPKMGVTMGENKPPATLRLLSPSGTALISSYPSFHWEAVPDATKYRFILRLHEDRVRKVIDLSFPASEPVWVLSDDNEPLSSGVYDWEVRAFASDNIWLRSRPTAYFQVLNAEAISFWNEIDRLYPGTPLIRAVAAMVNGMIVEAEAELQAALEADEQSETVKRLLMQIEMLRLP
jgi:hypothetical protein